MNAQHHAKQVLLSAMHGCGMTTKQIGTVTSAIETAQHIVAPDQPTTQATGRRGKRRTSARSRKPAQATGTEHKVTRVTGTRRGKRGRRATSKPAEVAQTVAA